MTFQPATRNRSGIRFEALRRDLDPLFELLHDSLSAAYYDHWRHGKSCPWPDETTLNKLAELGIRPKAEEVPAFDAQETSRDSKALFDKLHGLITTHHYILAFHAANQALTADKQIDRDQYDPPDEDEKRPTDYATDAIDAAKSSGVDLSALTGGSP